MGAFHLFFTWLTPWLISFAKVLKSLSFSHNIACICVPQYIAVPSEGLLSTCRAFCCSRKHCRRTSAAEAFGQGQGWRGKAGNPKIGCWVSILKSARGEENIEMHHPANGIECPITLPGLAWSWETLVKPIKVNVMIWTDWHNDRWIGRMTKWLIDWLIDWLIERLID